MLLEDILLAVTVGAVLVIVGWPIIRLLKVAPWRRRDPLAEAQERLRIAKIEAEAARVNREAEKIYEKLYEETIDGDGAGREGGGPRVAPEPGAESHLDTEIEKGKRHGHG
jgi:hypothetical protein